MEKLKVGIIGTGGISNFHINGYLKNPNVELYAFCDINEEKVKNMAEKYGVSRIYTDKDEMLKLKELDMVSVCTWNSAHAECTIAALNAGKHVLCEKPMAVSAEEAEKMKEAALRNQKLLMIGFVRRFENETAILRDFIDQDQFGEIYYTKASYLRRKGNPGGWFGDKSRSGGGPLIDLGVHVIDLVRYLSGSPKPVSAYGATFTKLYDRKNIKSTGGYVSTDKGERDICDVEDLATAMIRFDNGMVLSIDASFCLNIKRDVAKIELFGTKAGAKIENGMELYNEINDYMADVNLITTPPLSFDVIFGKEIAHFVDCVQNGTPCRAPAEDGIILMKILDAVYESARTGHEASIQL